MTGISPILDRTCETEPLVHATTHHLTLQIPSALLSVLVSFNLLLKTGICFQSRSSDKPTIKPVAQLTNSRQNEQLAGEQSIEQLKSRVTGEQNRAKSEH